ncbi:MAG: endonuclease/exonuclease/phosphatase family protein [Bacteroidaceae bacterium]|nr:endonuclease/exonuclease/phosphatase family protein [Bacteroidaceae bacterium]
MKALLLLILLLLPLLTPAQVADTLRVMWYNVENLFDCQDDPQKADEEFLPEGTHRWTPYRYWQKQRAVARVIAAVGDQRLPDIIGLCEVEGDSVLTDLTRRSPLRTAGYRYIVTHSPDERGIDVALLYLPGRFRPLSQRSISIHGGDRPTRDILHVQGLVSPTDTLELFLCHFPSRRGGERQSRPFRLLAAQTLRHAIDSVCQANPQSNVVIMGDFNDNLIDTRVAQELGVVPSSQVSSYPTLGLISLMADKQPGTYAYQGRWEIIDHILVSPSLLKAEGRFSTHPSLARIAALPFLLTTDEKYGIHVPHRTYMGPRHLGGFSDHLPIVVDFIKHF